jgi:hypothetical protein
MTWLFIVLGFSALVVVCVAIALYVRVRWHMKAAHKIRHEGLDAIEHERVDHI